MLLYVTMLTVITCLFQEIARDGKREQAKRTMGAGAEILGSWGHLRPHQPPPAALGWHDTLSIRGPPCVVNIQVNHAEYISYALLWFEIL